MLDEDEAREIDVLRVPLRETDERGRGDGGATHLLIRAALLHKIEHGKEHRRRGLSLAIRLILAEGFRLTSGHAEGEGEKRDLSEREERER